MDPLYAYHAGWLTPLAPPTATATKLVAQPHTAHDTTAASSGKDSATIVFDLTSFLPQLQARRKQQYLAVQDSQPVGALDLVHSYATIIHRIPTGSKQQAVVVQSQLLESYRSLDFLLCIGLQRQLSVRGRSFVTHCSLIAGSSPGMSLGVSHQHALRADNKQVAELHTSASTILTPDGIAADASCRVTSQQYGSLQLTERLQPHNRHSQLLSVVSGAHSVAVPSLSQPVHLAWSCALPSSQLHISHASVGVQLPHAVTHAEATQRLADERSQQDAMLPLHHAFAHIDYVASSATTVSLSYGIGVGNAQHQLQVGVLLSTSGVGLTFAYNTLHSRIALPVLLSNEPSARAVMAAALLIPSVCYATVRLLYAPPRRLQLQQQRQRDYSEQHERWQQHHAIAKLYEQAMEHRMQSHQRQLNNKDVFVVLTATYGRHWTECKLPAVVGAASLPSPMDVTTACRYFTDDKSRTLHFANGSKAYLPGFAPAEPLSPDVLRLVMQLPAVELHVTYRHRGITHTAVFADADKVQLP